jgi:putative spermidine/putrescine transport system ATP-binding protein
VNPLSTISDSERDRARPLLVLEGIRKTFDGRNFVVEDLNLEIRRGEFLTLLGPSGSGKTTSLLMLAGFEQPSSGRILLEGLPIEDLPPHRRGIGMVFQNYALFPHMTVAQNIAFPLEVRNTPQKEIARRIEQALDVVELPGLGSRRPLQLSGGQQQRVALARALVFEPTLVLMDEPLGALDKRLREQMQQEIKALHTRLGLTVVYVTHDQTEAMTMSDRIAVFHRGRIQQIDTPRQVHECPVNGFTAHFIGETNSAEGTVLSVEGSVTQLRLDSGLLVRGVASSPVQPGKRRSMFVRPERLRLGSMARELENFAQGVVQRTTYLGDRMMVAVELDGGLSMTADLGIAGVDATPVSGSRVTIGWAADHCLVLD